ncbi:MAG: tetratricopeptide repeat protein [Anaerolineae bacterium]|nr:tetratricopeptide repeat protein [Anaerolineae bacterium]
MNKRDEDINLAYAALLFSEYLTQPFDTARYLTLLDEIAETIEIKISGAEDDRTVIKTLNRHLFDALKFSGNIKNYYHPNNSLLNRVLDLRFGIPISLSVIYLEVGWRLGLPLWGVGLPGHFIVGFGSPDQPIFIDVFGRGRLLSEAECIDIARGKVSSPEKVRAIYLKPVLKKAILYRMLLNLKQIYVSAEQWETAYKVIDLMLTIYPQRPSELRDRGLIAYRLQHLQAATMDIERYLFLAPNSPDTEWLREHLEMMEKQLLRLN